MCTGTIVTVESKRRNRRGKGTTERCSQVRRINSGQRFLDFRPGTLFQVVMLYAGGRTACHGQFKISRMLKSADIITSTYLTRISLTVGEKTRSSRRCIGGDWRKSIGFVAPSITHIISVTQIRCPLQSMGVERVNGVPTVAVGHWSRRYFSEPYQNT